MILAKQRFNLRQRDVQSLHATFVPFTAQTRMSGINIQDRMIRKGPLMPFAVILKPIMDTSPEVDHLVESVARQGQPRWWWRKVQAFWGDRSEGYR